MNKKCSLHRTLAFFLLLCFTLSFSPPLGLVTSAEGASASASARIIKKLKKQIATLKAQLTAATVVPPTPASFVEMVTVGNVGNGTDAGNTGEASVYGAVPYEFKIGKTEVTLAQYTAFLNVVAATDAYGLYHVNMETDDNIKGILRSGSSGSFSYTVMGDGTRPVTYVSWFDAARFCNWLHNGRPTGLQATATTERGAYTLDGATTGGLTISRNPGAKFWIPSEDEWYKAAYHQPTDPGGDGDNYWRYPTRSNTKPGNAIGILANQANLLTSVYSVTQVVGYNASQNYLTAAVSFPGSASFYGTFDQGGNVFEWNDAVITASYRGLRGGSWSGDSGGDYLQSSSRFQNNPDSERNTIGFRVASP
jgi:sulfatase modifying factor 1